MSTEQRRRTAPVFLLASLLLVAVASGQPLVTSSPVFVFQTDDVWLNLHQFLYVLGRNEAGSADRRRRAVAEAPADEAQGMRALTSNEQARWRAAVTAYANGPSKQDAVFDAGLVSIANTLVRAGASAALGDAALDPSVRATLEAAAPLYRKAWWPAHRQANREWAASMRALAAEHGQPIRAFITRAYQLSWPEDGYAIHVAAYANWAGAFSTTGNLLIMSSLDPGLRGLPGLETTFHESMHQWDEAIANRIKEEAAKQGRNVSEALSHAIIFYTAGEATRSVVPAYLSYADANGIWRRGLAPFKAALDAVWRPYLAGHGTRDEAIAALVARVGSAR